MSQSKLDELIAAAAAESRFLEPAHGAQDEALRALRATQSRRSTLPRRRWLVAAGAASVAMVAFLAIPRPSDAAVLLDLLKQEPRGVVHEIHYSNGEKTMEVYRYGRVMKIVNPGGVEQLFEPGRQRTRYPAGYIVVSPRGASQEFMKGPSLRAFLERDGRARVRRFNIGERTRYVVEGEIVDAKGIRLSYEGAMEVDAAGSPLLQTSSLEGLGSARTEWVYDARTSDLTLAPVAEDRVYDLGRQREDLLARLDSLKPGKPQVVQAYVDEQGCLGLLAAVPDGAVPRNQPMIVAGEPRVAWNLSFNSYLGFQGESATKWKEAVADAQAKVIGAESRVEAIRHEDELDGPVRYKGLNLVLRAVKLDRVVEAPFTFQFPFWTQESPLRAQHPFVLGRSPARGYLASQIRLDVTSLERTSSVSELLSPMNMPFFLEKQQTGAAAHPAKQP